MLMTHILAELYDCLPLIEDEVELASAARTAAQAVGATVVGQCETRYTPHGLTVAVFLAESHVVLTTWPEYRLVLVDVLLCNPDMDYRAVVVRIKARICPAGNMVIHEVMRKIAPRP
jgi:S-adenosylmethionine decarboxylase